MCLNNGPGDSQPQARTPIQSLTGRVGTVETLRDAFKVFAREARPAVLDGDFHIFFRLSCSDDDASAFGSMTYGVVQNIREDLSHPSRINFNARKRRSEVEF